MFDKETTEAMLAAHDCDARLGQYVRTFFSRVKGDMGTSELAATLYPDAWVTAKADRQPLFDALARIASTTASDCTFRGPAKLNRYKQTIQPWRWRASDGSTPNPAKPRAPALEPLIARIDTLEERLATLERRPTNHA